MPHVYASNGHSGSAPTPLWTAGGRAPGARKRNEPSPPPVPPERACRVTLPVPTHAYKAPYPLALHPTGPMPRTPPRLAAAIASPFLRLTSTSRPSDPGRASASVSASVSPRPRSLPRAAWRRRGGKEGGARQKLHALPEATRSKKNAIRRGWARARSGTAAQRTAAHLGAARGVQCGNDAERLAPMCVGARGLGEIVRAQKR